MSLAIQLASQPQPSGWGKVVAAHTLFYPAQKRPGDEYTHMAYFLLLEDGQVEVQPYGWDPYGEDSTGSRGKWMRLQTISWRPTGWGMFRTKEAARMEWRSLVLFGFRPHHWGVNNP
jgi:hypothetical protein